MISAPWGSAPHGQIDTIDFDLDRFLVLVEEVVELLFGVSANQLVRIDEA